MPDGDNLDYYKLDAVPVRVNLDSAFMCVGCGVDQPPHQAGPDPRVTRYTIAHYHGAPAVYDWDSPECTAGLPPRHQCSSCRELSDARDAQRAREADAARDEWQTQLAEANNEEQEEARTRGRENQKRKRKEKQDGQLRRLAAAPEGRPVLKRLKTEQLKLVCKANRLLVSGCKDQLVERILGCRLHGSLGTACPRCGGAKLELGYAGNGLEPNEVRCKHMKGMGRPCGWNRAVTPTTKGLVLQGRLADSPGGDLLTVGMLCFPRPQPQPRDETGNCEAPEA
jgi:hypothetical protein